MTTTWAPRRPPQRRAGDAALVAVAGLGALGFAVLSVLVAGGELDGLDRRAHGVLVLAPHGGLVGPARVLALLGSAEVSALVMLGLGVTALRARHRRAAVVAALVALLVASALEAGLKRWLDHAAPEGIGDLSFGLPTPGSYPSGHALRIVVLSAAVVAIAPGRWRRPAAVALLLLSALVVSTRLLLGSHWVSDVIGGLLLGGAAAAGVLLARVAEPGSPR